MIKKKKKMSTEEKKENLISSKDSQNEIRLSRCVRVFIFGIFWLIHFFNCSDGGVPSASSNNIKKDLNFTDTQFGQYGSIVQLGRMTGTLIVMSLLNVCSRKYLIFVALLFKCASFLIYFISINYYVVMTFRYIQGVSHVFTYVYFPTWIDQFGFQSSKTMMMSLIQTASPFGSVFGFSVTTFIGTHYWKWGFGILAFSILPLNFFLLFIPDKYFSAKIFFKKKIEEKYDNGIIGTVSIFEEDETKKKKKEGNSNEKSDWWSMFDGVFIFIVLARTVIMFIFMGIHYWLGDYFVNVLEIKDKLAKTSSYGAISLLGPFFGSMIGGAVCEKFGGYEKKSSIFVCIFFSVLTCISGAIVPEVKSLGTFTAAVFAFFVFANCQMPILIGISFNCVPRSLKVASYGINSLMCTFLGNLLAPSVYGYLNDLFKMKDKRMAMRCVMNYIWINLIYLILCAIFKYRKKDDIPIEENPNDGQEMQEKE